MNYFSVDISSKNRAQPSHRMLQALPVLWGHEYGMSLSSHPDAWVDHIINVRTHLDKDALWELFKENGLSVRSIRPLKPVNKTCRHKTVEEELDLASETQIQSWAVFLGLAPVKQADGRREWRKKLGITTALVYFERDHWYWRPDAQSHATTCASEWNALHSLYHHFHPQHKG